MNIKCNHKGNICPRNTPDTADGTKERACLTGAKTGDTSIFHVYKMPGTSLHAQQNAQLGIPHVKKEATFINMYIQSPKAG